MSMVEIKDPKQKKTIGILGGMGPMATVDLFRKIVEYTDASSDQEHAHILIDCNTQIPDRTIAILRNSLLPLQELISSAQKLETWGAELILIPCNTSHFFIDRIQESIGVPIINMIEEAAMYIESLGYQNAIILGTEGIRSAEVYSTYFSQHGIHAVYPPDPVQEEITNVIYKGIKAGTDIWNTENLNQKIKELEDSNNAISVLACTELPIAQKRYGLKGNFVDPTAILAISAIRYAGYHLKGQPY